MNCQEIQDLLSAHADHELDEKESQVVGAHLRGCEACRRGLAEIQQLDALLETCPTAAPSLNFNARLKARLDRERLAMRLWRLPMVRLTAAAVLLATLVTAVMLSSYHPAATESAVSVTAPVDLPNLDLLTNPSFLGTELSTYGVLFPGLADAELPLFTAAADEGGVS